MADKQGTFSDYLREEELARELDVTTRTLRRWRRLRIGPPVLKMGPRRLVYKAADVRAWIEAAGR